MVLSVEVSTETAVEAVILHEADGVEVAAVAIHASVRHVGEVEVGGQLESLALAVVRRAAADKVAEVDEVLLVVDFVVSARRVVGQADGGKVTVGLWLGLRLVDVRRIIARQAGTVSEHA